MIFHTPLQCNPLLLFHWTWYPSIHITCCMYIERLHHYTCKLRIRIYHSSTTTCNIHFFHQQLHLNQRFSYPHTSATICFYIYIYICIIHTVSILVTPGEIHFLKIWNIGDMAGANHSSWFTVTPLVNLINSLPCVTVYLKPSRSFEILSSRICVILFDGMIIIIILYVISSELCSTYRQNIHSRYITLWFVIIDQVQW